MDIRGGFLVGRERMKREDKTYFGGHTFIWLSEYTIVCQRNHSHSRDTTGTPHPSVTRVPYIVRYRRGTRSAPYTLINQSTRFCSARWSHSSSPRCLLDKSRHVRIADNVCRGTGARAPVVPNFPPPSKSRRRSHPCGPCAYVLKTRLIRHTGLYFQYVG